MVHKCVQEIGQGFFAGGGRENAPGNEADVPSDGPSDESSNLPAEVDADQ